jgi:hypothetical protein
MTPDETRRNGFKHAVSWLQQSGYQVAEGAPAGDSLEIAVDHPSARILVRLNIGVRPERPPDLTKKDADELRARAASLGRRPYAARVLLDPNGNLLGGVRWQNLP